MIPVSKDSVTKWADDDGSVFGFRPIIGECELDLYEATTKLSVDPTPFLPAAKAEVEKIKGKKWEKGEKDEETRRAAIRLASESRGGGFDKTEAAAMYRIIDMIVVSCTHDGKTVKFDKDASEHFSLVDNTKLFGAIMSQNELKDDERKN